MPNFLILVPIQLINPKEFYSSKILFISSTFNSKYIKFLSSNPYIIYHPPLSKTNQPKQLSSLTRLEKKRISSSKSIDQVSNEEEKIGKSCYLATADRQSRAIGNLAQKQWIEPRSADARELAIKTKDA